jgi:hypothetical protein
MQSESPTALRIEGLNELEIAELRKTFRDQGIDLDSLATTEYASLPSARLGEPGTAIILFELGKIALPLCAGVIAGWLSKGRSRKRFRSLGFSLRRGELTLGYVSGEDLTEEQTPESIQARLVGLDQGAGHAGG